MNSPSEPNDRAADGLAPDVPSDATTTELIRDVPAPTPEQTEAHIAAAMAVFDGRLTAERSRRRSTAWLSIAAATVAVLVGVGAIVISTSHTDRRTTSAGAPLQADRPTVSNREPVSDQATGSALVPEREADSGGGGADKAIAPPVAPDPDLGSFDTIEQLLSSISAPSPATAAS